MDLSTTYLGMRLPHPLVVGAGPLGDELEHVRELEDAGASAIAGSSPAGCLGRQDRRQGLIDRGIRRAGGPAGLHPDSLLLQPSVPATRSPRFHPAPGNRSCCILPRLRTCSFGRQRPAQLYRAKTDFMF